MVRLTVPYRTVIIVEYRGYGSTVFYGSMVFYGSTVFYGSRVFCKKTVCTTKLNQKCSIDVNVR